MTRDPMQKRCARCGCTRFDHYRVVPAVALPHPCRSFVEPAPLWLRAANKLISAYSTAMGRNGD